MIKKITPIVLAVTLVALLGGCATYHLGDGNKAKYHNIAFAPVINRSFAPQIQPLLSDALFRSFAQGGGMAVTSQQGNAEVVLHVTINEFHKMIGATSSIDTGRARSLSMAVKATAALKDAAGLVIYTQEFEVQQDFYADNGMERAENEAMPQLADMLAKKIYRAAISNW